MSNESGSNNRGKVLFGFGAVVAVLIVAILMWPSNVRKEDASGAIGAVQKHHAPQITQQDVILGGEQVKAQQKLLYTDFREDAGKLRSLAASRSVDGIRSYQAELAMRAMHAARDGVAAAKSVATREQLAALNALDVTLAAKQTLSDEDLQQVAMNLQALASYEQEAMARVAQEATALSHMSLADEAAASRALHEFDLSLNDVDLAHKVVAEADYLSMMQAESVALARGTAESLELAASKLESKANANLLADQAFETNLAGRLSEADEFFTASRKAESAMMGNDALRDQIEAAASKVRQREALASALNARQN